MNIFQIIILSIIEGLTEFLPVSSTAHLIVASKILNITQNNFHKLFEVFIQSGAILAVIFLYRETLFKNKKILINIFFAFIPTAFFGFLFYKIIKNIFFESLNLIVFSLIFGGIIFILIEILNAKKKIILAKENDQMIIKEALLIGFFQSFAIVPGVSRAGAVMIGMMILGFKREESAIFSFLLAVPTIFSASFFDLYKNKEILFMGEGQFFTLFLGAFFSFIFALSAVKFFISFLKKKNLIVFGLYRIILAIIILLLALP
ncbi:MAG: undecaprenyl-diphosphate phosphatase [Microgenomates group bacterium]